jgi:hypothetical protein
MEEQYGWDLYYTCYLNLKFCTSVFRGFLVSNAVQTKTLKRCIATET